MGKGLGEGGGHGQKTGGCAGWKRERARVGEQGVVEYLARLLGVGGVEGGGGHGVHLQESPHGPQEALVPQKQCCHLTLHSCFRCQNCFYLLFRHYFLCFLVSCSSYLLSDLVACWGQVLACCSMEGYMYSAADCT